MSAAPGDAQQLVGLVVAVVELALVGVLQRVADAPRQMRAGRGHQDAAAVGFDGHDALQRVAALLRRLAAAHAPEDLLAVLVDELPLHRDVPGRKAVADALARRAAPRVRSRPRRAPAPAPAGPERAAVLATRGL